MYKAKLNSPLVDLSHDNGLLFVLSGPSGVGKGTVVAKLLPNVANLYRSISMTTRSRRPNEEEGTDYFFRTTAQFKEAVKKNEFLEWTEYAGSLYGTPVYWVMNKLKCKQDVILVIEVQGALSVVKQIPQSVLIFLAPPSFAELEKRLRSRSTENTKEIEKRLKKAKTELSKSHVFNYRVVNDNLAMTIAELKHIINQERQKLGRQDKLIIRKNNEHDKNVRSTANTTSKQI